MKAFAGRASTLGLIPIQDQLLKLKKEMHQNGSNSDKLSGIELKFGVVVAEGRSQHKL